MQTLNDFLLMREDLAFKISKFNGILGRLGLQDRSLTLTSLENSCHKASFRVLIAGEFKRGKSCLVNAMLGDSVLPMKVAPCTTTISEVSYGDTPKLIVEANDGTHEVSFTDRFQYCTIQGHKTLPAEQKPIHKVKMEYPSSVCSKCVTLIDSPGLNEDWSRTQTSLREIAQADVLMLVLSCEMALSQSEQLFIQSHLLPYKDRLFFLWNRADAIWDKPSEKEALKQRSDEHLSKYSDQIYFVSAREGLLGKIQQDDAQWTKSNIPMVLQKMEQFLVQNQTKSKLEGFWQQSMQMSTYTLFQLIPRMEHLLQSSEDSVKEYKLATEAVERAERDRVEQIQSEIAKTTGDLLTTMEERFIQFIDRIPSKIATDADNLTFEPRISRQEREDIIIDWFNQWLQQALHLFTQDELRTTMEASFSDLKIQVDAVRMDHIVAIDEALDCNADEIQLFSGRWIEETSLLITTALSLMLLKIDRDLIAKNLLKVRALRGWLMGSTLNEGDRLKLAKQLQQTLHTEQGRVIAAQKSHMNETTTHLQQSIEQDLRLTRLDAMQQIETVLKLHTSGKQDTSLEQQQLQLETLRLSVHTMHSQLRTMMTNL